MSKAMLRPVPAPAPAPAKVVRQRRRRLVVAPPHTFLVETIRVISASGAEKEINPRAWARYGLEVEP